jgi:adenylate cyclase
MRICKRAVELDPNYAQAWALLAIAQSNLRYGFGRSVDDGVAAAHTALAIDPNIAEAYCAMARRLQEMGKCDEAMAELQKGLALDPESWDLNKAAANFLMTLGKLEQAIPHFEKAASVAETDYHAWGMLQTCYEGIGNRDQAAHAAKLTLEQAERVLAQDPSNGAAISFAVSALASMGESERAREWMDRALLIDPDNLNMRYNFACALAKYLDDREGALAMLEYSITRVQGALGNVESDPDLESIRGDPRFLEMVAEAKQRLGIDGVTAAPAEAANPPAAS